MSVICLFRFINTDLLFGFGTSIVGFFIIFDYIIAITYNNILKQLTKKIKINIIIDGKVFNRIKTCAKNNTIIK